MSFSVPGLTDLDLGTVPWMNNTGAVLGCPLVSYNLQGLLGLGTLYTVGD